MIPIVDFHLIENDPLARTGRATLASEAVRLDGEGVLVGVSGGRDSMVLLAVLAALAGPLRLQRLGVAHYHHGLRGAAAGRDAGLVEQTALSAGLPYS